MSESLTGLVQQVERHIRTLPQVTPPGRKALPLPTDARGLAPFIDHTLLRADATAAQVEALCDEARRFGFATVCVNGSMVATAARALEGSPVLPIAVVGFPLGAMSTTAKAFEAADAVRSGAREIDMVLAIGALQAGDDAAVRDDIAAVVAASQPWPVKVILETCLLDEEQKIRACRLAREAGAAFVKTSTGFGGGGATEADVALLRRSVGDALSVKASGGIRTTEQAMAMLRAGADRIGASASVAIVGG